MIIHDKMEMMEVLRSIYKMMNLKLQTLQLSIKFWAAQGERTSQAAPLSLPPNRLIKS